MYKEYANPKGIPDLNNDRPKRLYLKVNSKGLPVDQYWRRRLAEDGIEEVAVVNDKVEPELTKKTTTTKTKSEKDDS